MSISEKELKDLENRQKHREFTLKILRSQKEEQNNCPHTQGLSSSSPPHNSPSAFHALKLWDGEIVAVCPYCKKKISSKNPEDVKYFSAPGNYWIEYPRIAESGDPRKPIIIDEEDQQEAFKTIKENNDFQITKDYLWNLSLEKKLLKIDREILGHSN